MAVLDRLALVLGALERIGECRSLGLTGGLGDRWVQVLDRVLQSNCQAGQRRLGDGAAGDLQVGDLGERGRLVERVLLEGDGLGNVVDADGELAALASDHEELFKLLLVGLPARLLERADEVEDVLDRDRRVELGKVLQQAGEDDLAQARQVGRIVGVLGKGGDEGRDRLAGGERVEVGLDEGVQLAELTRDPTKDVLVDLRDGESSASALALRTAAALTTSLSRLCLVGIFCKLSRATRRWPFLVSAASPPPSGTARALRSTQPGAFSCETAGAGAAAAAACSFLVLVSCSRSAYCR